MKAKSFFLLLICTGAMFQGCKLERIDPQCPTITGLQPSAAGIDEIVSIKGRNFYSSSPELYRIFIANKPVAVFDVPDSTTLRFKVPRGIGSGEVSVAFASGLSCNVSQNMRFTYYYRGASVSTIYNQPLLSPQGLDLDNFGSLVVSDSGNFQIRVIDPATGSLIRTYGIGGQGTVCDGDAMKVSNAHFFASDIDVDLRGNIYIAESARNMIRWIDPRNPDTVKIYAGKCSISGPFTPRSDTVHRLSTILSRPYGVFRDDVSNSLYFTDNLGIRKIFNSLVHVPKKKDQSSERYRGIEINRFRKDNIGPVIVTDLGGEFSVSSPGAIVSLNDQGVASSLKNAALISPLALTLDSSGNIFIADYVANQILVLYTNGVLKILAGTGVGGDNNLPVTGLQANFKRPAGIAIAEKDDVVAWVYVSDSGNNKVKAIKVE